LFPITPPWRRDIRENRVIWIEIGSLAWIAPVTRTDGVAGGYEANTWSLSFSVELPELELKVLSESIGSSCWIWRKSVSRLSVYD